MHTIAPSLAGRSRAQQPTTLVARSERTTPSAQMDSTRRPITGTLEHGSGSALVSDQPPPLHRRYCPADVVNSYGEGMVTVVDPLLESDRKVNTA